MRVLLGALLIFIFFANSLIAEDNFPLIPKATGKPHPEGNEFIRINHMDLLRHDRDLVVKEGIRNIDNSLAQCVTCHVVRDENNEPVTYESEEYFCRVCHDYVAVKLDCFTCHNSVPSAEVSISLFRDENAPFERLMAYLEEKDNDR